MQDAYLDAYLQRLIWLLQHIEIIVANSGPMIRLLRIKNIYYGWVGGSFRGEKSFKGAAGNLWSSLYISG